MSPILTLIQAAQIWIDKDAAGVSLIAWTGYLFISLVWLFYGKLHKERPIVVVQSSALVGYILIIAGTLKF